MKSFLQIALALLALSTTQCATQTAAQTLAPTTRAPIDDDTFAAIASQVRNPCKNIPERASLLGALQSDRVCYEASILADDIVFFKSQGLNADQTIKMMVAEYESIVAPHAFRTDGRPRMGSNSAPVEVVIFSDFQCPFCARAAKTMHRIAERYPQDASIVFKQMPLVSIHPYAAAAAVVTTFANEKDMFWQIHDTLFDDQKSISASFLTKQIERLGATPEDVFDPVKGQRLAVVIVEDMADAEKADIAGTPTVFVDGVHIQGGANFERVAARIEAIRYAQNASLERTHLPPKLDSKSAENSQTPPNDEQNSPQPHDGEQNSPNGEQILPNGEQNSPNGEQNSPQSPNDEDSPSI